MKSPNPFRDKKSGSQLKQNPEKNNKRDNLLTPFLLAFPVIFIIIALTKVLASEEYIAEPLEKESVSWKIPVDTVVPQTDSIE